MVAQSPSFLDYIHFLSGVGFEPLTFGWSVWCLTNWPNMASGGTCDSFRYLTFRGRGMVALSTSCLDFLHFLSMVRCVPLTFASWVRCSTNWANLASGGQSTSCLDFIYFLSVPFNSEGQRYGCSAYFLSGLPSLPLCIRVCIPDLCIMSLMLYQLS